MKIEKRWIISFVVITLVAFAGLFKTEQQIVIGDFLTADQIVGADVAWILAAAGLVLLMTPGLSFFYGGMVGSINVISTMLQSFIALGVISILWVVVGFSLSFGESLGITIDGVHYGLIGNPLTYPFLMELELYPIKL